MPSTSPSASPDSSPGSSPPAAPGGAVITGGAKGIGRAISFALARRGHHVVVTGRDEAALAAAVKDIGTEVPGARATAVPLDVTSTGSVRRAFAAVRELTSLSVLVNNAGVITRQRAEELPDDEWSRVIETDLGGVFRCSRAALPLLEEQGGGAIVNVASIAASVGISGRVAYTASKAGVEGLTRTLALEWAARGIRVNTVAPGWTRTEMVDSGIKTGGLDGDALAARIPMGRLAHPDEIADAVSYLASPQAGYITGQTLVVDGGITINGNA